MIPILEEAGVAVAPLDALPTIKDYIKLVWGHFTGEENFKVDFSKGSVCCQPTDGRTNKRQKAKVLCARKLSYHSDSDSDAPVSQHGGRNKSPLRGS